MFNVFSPSLRSFVKIFLSSLKRTNKTTNTVVSECGSPLFACSIANKCIHVCTTYHILYYVTQYNYIQHGLQETYSVINCTSYWSSWHYMFNTPS